MKEILYKYQTWQSEFHKKSFINSELFFANNFILNDPYDCQLPLILKGSRPIPVKAFQKRFKKENNFEISEEQILSKLQKWEELNEVMKKEINKDLKVTISNLEDKMGILCLSQTNSNTLMWGHYANSHKGYCLGFNRKLLIAHLKLSMQNFEILKVKYVKEIPQLDISINDSMKHYESFVLERILTKFIDWKYENEVRIVSQNFTNQTHRLPSEILTKLIFGYKISKTDRLEITEIARDTYPNLKFYEAKPSNKHFKMEIKIYSP